MIEGRVINEDDIIDLEISLSNDEYHKGTTAEFFYAPGTACTVYSDENGPIMFLRGTKALRVDIQFIDNDDRARNAKVLIEGFDKFCENARNNGFTELVFNTTSNLLEEFCKSKLGYSIVEGKELRYFL